MAKFIVALVLAAVLLSFASCVLAASGTATQYTPLNTPFDPYTPTLCGWFGEEEGVMEAAASDAIWDKGAACDRRYLVTCTGPTNQIVPQPCKGTSVVVTIIQHCSAACQSTIGLSLKAFSTIADPIAGKIKINYAQV